MKFHHLFCLILALVLVLALFGCTEQSTDEFSVKPPADTLADPEASDDPTDSTDSETPPADPAAPFTLLPDGRVLFGSYPQTRVADAALCATLSAKAGALPTVEEKGDWHPFAPNAADWYIDVTEGEACYRGLYFTEYRPSDITEETPNGAHSAQYANGYEIGRVYWFRYEALCWRILQSGEGGALLLCESVIDVQHYAESIEGTQLQGETLPANDYIHSAMRMWLTERFFSVAFDEDSQGVILQTSRTYNGGSADDAVFLASLGELCDAALGFDAAANTADTARARPPRIMRLRGVR